MAITGNLGPAALDAARNSCQSMGGAFAAQFHYHANLAAGAEVFIPFITGRDGAAVTTGADASNDVNTKRVTMVGVDLVVEGVEAGWLIKFGAETKWYTVAKVLSPLVFDTLEVITDAHASVAYSAENRRILRSANIRIVPRTDMAGLDPPGYLLAHDNTIPGTVDATDPRGWTEGAASAGLLFTDLNVGAKGIKLHNFDGVAAIDLHVTVGVF